MPQKLILGASRSVIDGTAEWPIHGLRHPADGLNSGWFVWSGEISEDDDFFAAWHHEHFVEQWPQIAHLLELPPGSRFLVAPGHEDIWGDATLLDV